MSDMAKIPVAYKLSALTVKRILLLSKKKEASKTAIVEQAVKTYAETENIK